MSESESPRDRSASDVTPPLRGEELLPPVEEPNVGFILQLFIVPALIVFVIVTIWVMFNWLVHRAATKPKDLIQSLQQGPSVARWQRASELAEMLRNKRFADLRRDPEAATQLAQILDREINAAGDSSGMDEEDVTLRFFLARALGEFEVNEGIDVLLKAARTERDPKEQFMRHGALEAIAMRAYNLSQLKPPRKLAHPELESTLIELVGDQDPLIRKRASYALGQLGTPAALEQLTVTVDDPHPDTRFNAAIAIAHAGRAEAIETLAEMLDLEEPPGVDEESNAQDQAMKRAVIFSNALAAVEKLAAERPDADYSVVIESLEHVAKADDDALAKARIPSRLAAESRRVLEELQIPK